MTRSSDSPITPRNSSSLWLIRHAEVEERYQTVFGGRIDMELSAKGRKQAGALATFIQHRRFDAIYASPMKRVQQTLVPLVVKRIAKPIIVQELREVDFGAWTGMSWEQVQSRFGISPFAWLDQLECNGIEKAECAADFRKRLEPWLGQLLTAHEGQQVALFCHGGVIRMLLSILLDWPFSKFGAIEIDYASLTHVVCHPFGARLQLVNFTPWRDLAQAENQQL